MDIPDKIDAIAQRLEDSWKDGTPVSLEELLAEGEGLGVPQGELLGELLLIDCEFRVRAEGAFPLEDYLRRFPEDEPRVRQAVKEVSRYASFLAHQFPKYRDFKRIGEGGMGVVYRAVHRQGDYPVAIKLIKPELAGHALAMERSENEQRIMGQLDHPNLIHIKGCGTTDTGLPYSIIDYVDGVSLDVLANLHFGRYSGDRDKLAAWVQPWVNTHANKAAWQDAMAQLVLQAARGLAYLHTKRIVHRDIKPTNLMLREDGTLKILDLGLGKFLRHETLRDDTMTVAGTVLGSLHYMSPEQIRQPAEVDIRSDIYSLGVTFRYLLCGSALTDRAKKDAPPVPKKLAAIIAKMTQQEAPQRYATPDELIRDLERFLEKRTWRRLAVAVVPTVALACFLGYSLLYKAPGGGETLLPGNTSEAAVLPLPGRAAPAELIRLTDGRSLDVQEKIRQATELRYAGNSEAAREILEALEDVLRYETGNQPSSLAGESLAGVLAEQVNCDLFFRRPGAKLSEKRLRTLQEKCRDGLQCLADVSRPVLKSELLYKSAMLEILCEEQPNLADRLAEARALADVIPQDKRRRISLLRQLTEAMSAKTDLHLLKKFVENFELSQDPELFARENLELRLFALEYLVGQSRQAAPEMLGESLRMLDNVLLYPWHDDTMMVYLNRFFDLAINACPKDDHARVVRYLYRLRPQRNSASQPEIPEGASMLLFYFSPTEPQNGFAIFYPYNAAGAVRFDLPFTRGEIRQSIETETPMALDASLVSLVRGDMQQKIPLVLSWDDTKCWPTRRDSFSNNDWPFDLSVTIGEILGQMK